jgi:hypothetical protein
VFRFGDGDVAVFGFDPATWSGWRANGWRVANVFPDLYATIIADYGWSCLVLVVGGHPSQMAELELDVVPDP